MTISYRYYTTRIQNRLLITKLNKVKELVSDDIPEINVVKTYPSSYVTSLLAPYDIQRLPLDGTYYMTDKSNSLNIVAWDWIDNKQYFTERFDCSNFALSFKAHVDEVFGLNQVGLVIDYVTSHAYNVVVFPDNVVMLFEPQSDSLFFLKDRNEGVYYFKNSIVLI